MIERRPFDDLSGEDIGWLKAKHHFSFGQSADAAPNGLGYACASGTTTSSLPTRVFPPHAHANMEIITYVREGAVTHKDSLGNERPHRSRRRPGDECRRRYPPR